MNNLLPGDFVFHFRLFSDRNQSKMLQCGGATVVARPTGEPGEFRFAPAVCSLSECFCRREGRKHALDRLAECPEDHVFYPNTWNPRGADVWLDLSKGQRLATLRQQAYFEALSAFDRMINRRVLKFSAPYINWLAERGVMLRDFEGDIVFHLHVSHRKGRRARTDRRAEPAAG